MEKELWQIEQTLDSAPEGCREVVALWWLKPGDAWLCFLDLTGLGFGEERFGRHPKDLPQEARLQLAKALETWAAEPEVVEEFVAKLLLSETDLAYAECDARR